jgi:tetratricopeptide (TPR) repeat protein
VRAGRLAAIAFALLLAGCAANPAFGPAGPRAPGSAAGNVPGNSGGDARSDTANDSRDSSSGAGAGAEFPAPSRNAAVTDALLVQSRDQRIAGNLGGAAATIERAITISPDEAVLWLELAEIRRDQGDRALAEEIARKALTLTSENSALAARARRLLGR